MSALSIFLLRARHLLTHFVILMDLEALSLDLYSPLTTLGMWLFEVKLLPSPLAVVLPELLSLRLALTLSSIMLMMKSVELSMFLSCDSFSQSIVLRSSLRLFHSVSVASRVS